jgi:hypothetical protein
MGRNAAAELQRIVATISTYLDAAQDDGARSVTYAGIEKATGVSRGHLSRRSEAEILALVDRIESIKRSRNSGATTAGPLAVDVVPAAVGQTSQGTLDAHATETLAEMARRDLQELARVQQQWVARHAQGPVQEAPLALYDADDLLRRLRATVERMRPVVAELTRRQGLAVEADVHGAASLMLRTKV